MNAQHILARFDRVHDLLRRRGERSVVSGNVFLTLCLAADAAAGEGVCATVTAARVGMSVKSAHAVLSRLVKNRRGGRPQSRYFATAKVYELLGLKPLNQEAAT